MSIALTAIEFRWQLCFECNSNPLSEWELSWPHTVFCAVFTVWDQTLHSDKFCEQSHQVCHKRPHFSRYAAPS